MIYRHEKYGDSKTYSVITSTYGSPHIRPVYKVREFSNGCRKSELTLSEEEKIMFEKKLKENGWYANN